MSTRRLTSLLASRYMSAKTNGGFVTLISWVSMAGVMLGVATLILVTSLMNGIRQEMLRNFTGIDGHIRISERYQPIGDYPELMKKLTLSLDASAELTPRIDGQVMVTGATKRAVGAQVMGMRAEDMARKPLLNAAIADEVRAAFADGDGVVVGIRLAQSLGLKPGDAITLISPQSRATAFGTVPRIKSYPVIGMMELGMHALDSSLVLMPYEDARVYFSLSRLGEHPASLIEVTLSNGANAEEAARSLAMRLGKGYYVLPWQRAHQSIFTALEIQRNVMVIILTLIILVAVFNIISSLVMMVKDKRGDIAILRTMGMQRPEIIRLFMLTGIRIGVIGTTLGCALGLLAATYLEDFKRAIETMIGQEILVADVYFLSTLPTQTSWVEVAWIVVMSLVLALLATIYPAYHAASVDPAEALRHV